MIIKGKSAEMAAWAGRRFDRVFHPPFEAWGITDTDGAITGVVVFNGFDGWDIEVSVVGTGWTRKVVREIARHCYCELGCFRVSFTTRADNHLAISLVERMGGKREGVKRRFFGDCDALIFGVLKDEFRFGGVT